MMIKRQLKRLLFFGLFVSALNLFPSAVKAQDPEVDPDHSVPIDGGVGLLVIAGVGYGIKKHRDNRKKEKEANLS